MLEANNVAYLVVGGYAVGFYGYPRPTGGLDIWVSRDAHNAKHLVSVLNDFGFSAPEISEEFLTLEKSIIRMGVPPFKLELITFIDGVSFDEAYAARREIEIDGTPIKLISLEHLKINKAASRRPKDLNDLENLP